MTGEGRVRVGFLGCGLIAQHHARSLGAAAAADIVACHDLDPERAAAFAATFGGDAVAGPDEVIEASDAVYVCTWTSAHPELVAAVADAGRAVFCEKPLAVDLATAEAMTSKVTDAGVVNQVGLILRHMPPFRWLEAVLRTADVGRVMSIVFRDDQYIPIQGMYGSDWRADAARAGAGTLLEHSIHDLDLLAWMLGDDNPISAVSARTANFHGHPGIEDLALVTLHSESGASASLTSIWHDLLDRPSQRRVEVFCERGWFHLTNEWSGPVEFTIGDRGGALEGAELAAAAADLDGADPNPDVDFIAAVVARRAAYPDFAKALAAHRLCDAAYRSASAGGDPIQLA